MLHKPKKETKMKNEFYSDLNTTISGIIVVFKPEFSKNNMGNKRRTEIVDKMCFFYIFYIFLSNTKKKRGKYGTNDRYDRMKNMEKEKLLKSKRQLKYCMYATCLFLVLTMRSAARRAHMRLEAAYSK